MPDAALLLAQIRRLERGYIGAINREQEKERLTLRGLELKGTTSGAAVDAVRARLAELQARYQVQEAKLIELRKGQRATVVIAADGFFYQAEDGIRVGTVTGVQTCALPI